jgi:hypothetical protein
MVNEKKFPHIGRGNQRLILATTRTTFNIDNGSGTTADDASVGPFPFDCYIVSARAVYTEATDSSGAEGASFKTGVSAGGATLVGATALQVSKAIGAYTEATPLEVRVPADTTIWTRHTGIAATDAGQYFVEYLILPKP